MFVKAEYFGFYPLGSDVLLQGTKIMQTTWSAYKFPVIVVGKKNVVSPLFAQVYYVTNDNQIIFFVAIEYGFGHYHIFTINEKSQQRLSKRIKM